MGLREQIACALAENFDGPNGCMIEYLPHAKVAMTFIAAERERCAVIADERATMWRDRARVDREKGRDDALAAMAAAEVKRTAAAIRSQS